METSELESVLSPPPTSYKIQFSSQRGEPPPYIIELLGNVYVQEKGNNR